MVWVIGMVADRTVSIFTYVEYFTECIKRLRIMLAKLITRLESK